jgi:hypothetical protein
MTHKFRNPELARVALIAAALGATMSYTGETTGGIASDVNFLPGRNVYPGMDGGTLATLGSASSPDAYNSSGAGGSEQLAPPPAVDTPPSGVGGLAWWVGIVMVIGLIMFAAKKTGNAGEFSNLRASTYNILLITLVAVVGLTGLKIMASKIKNVPGLSGFSQVLLAA